MDISDGLVGDCDKLAAASGCAAVIQAERVPLPRGLLQGPDTSMLARLLTAGDDYEILSAVPAGNEAGFRAAARSAGVAVTRIGALTAGTGPTQVASEGRALALHRRSWVHGSAAETDEAKR
jgi:thiamine-monophosphate kinase